MSKELDALFRTAGRQYGLLRLDQIQAVLSRGQARRWLGSGRLARVGRGVYLVPGAPPSWRQRALAACFAYPRPVALSGRAAARLWELDGIAGREIEVSVPPGKSGRVSGVATRRRTLPQRDIADRFGIPVTTLGRTLADLAGVVPPGALGRAVDDMLSRRLVSVAELVAHLERAHRPGVAALRRLVSEREAEGGAFESAWEAMLYRWVIEAGLPPPVLQYQLVVNGIPRTLDLAYPEEMVAAEFQGFRYHALRRGRFDADQDRISDLMLAGWLVVLVTSNSSRSATVARVRRALQQRGAAL